MNWAVVGYTELTQPISLQLVTLHSGQVSHLSRLLAAQDPAATKNLLRVARSIHIYIYTYIHICITDTHTDIYTHKYIYI